MAKLIRFELRKLFRSKYLYILTLIALVFVVISGLTSMLVNSFIEPEDAAFKTTLYDFVKSSIGGFSLTILAIFVAIFACEDASQGTSKNVASKGYSRISIFYSKYIVSLVAFLFISILCIALSYFFGLAIFDKGEVKDNLAILIPGVIFGLASYHALYFLFGYIFNKIGAAVAINIIGPRGVSLILTLVDTSIRNENFQISKYWIDGVFSTVINNGNAQTQDVVVAFVLIGLYIAICLSVGAIVANKKEIK